MPPAFSCSCGASPGETHNAFRNQTGSDFKDIYLGNGKNLIYDLSGGVLPDQTNLGAAAHWVNVNIGSGNSEVLGTTAPGSTITATGGAHHDILNISPDIRFVGLTTDDKLLYDDYGDTPVFTETNRAATLSP